MRQRTVRSEKSGDGTTTFAEQFGMGFEATSYGQAALQMDVSGLLEELGGQQVDMGATLENSGTNDQSNFDLFYKLFAAYF